MARCILNIVRKYKPKYLSIAFAEELVRTEIVIYKSADNGESYAIILTAPRSNKHGRKRLHMDKYDRIRIRRYKIVIRSQVLRLNMAINDRIFPVYGCIRPFTEFVTFDLGNIQRFSISSLRRDDPVIGNVFNLKY
jgi:hypothetical protein